MATDEEQRAFDGISRRSVLRGGLLAGAGVATVGAMSVVLTGTANAAAPNPQPGWGYCIYCRIMWWVKGQPNIGCPGNLGGNHAVAAGYYNYELYNNISGLNNKSNPQPGWRWCKNCHGLFWGGKSGHCYAAYNIGPHVAGSGTSYDTYWNLGGHSDPQPNWRWCQNCSLLYWQGASGTEAGYCPILDPNLNYQHLAGSSTNYNLYWNGTW